MTTSVENLTVSDLASLLVNASDKELNEFNYMFDELEIHKSRIEALERENRTLRGVQEKYKVLKEQSETVLKNGENHLNAAKQAYRERDQMFDSLEIEKTLLRKYKEIDTPKKILEKIKNGKAKIADLTDKLNKSKTTSRNNLQTIDLLSGTVENLRTNINRNYMSIVKGPDTENLVFVPSKLYRNLFSCKESICAFIYIPDGSSSATILRLDELDTIDVSEYKDGELPNNTTLVWAEYALRRWKRNGWDISNSDLEFFV